MQFRMIIPRSVNVDSHFKTYHIVHATHCEQSVELVNKIQLNMVVVLVCMKSNGRTPYAAIVHGMVDDAILVYYI